MTKIACRGLLFDMDGVLVDSTAAVARVWSRWALKHNLDADAVVRQAHGRPSMATIQELLPQADAAVHRLEDEWMERAEIEDIADVVALPGSRELLGALPPGQFAVVTSATRDLAEIRLRAAGLLDLTRHLVTASDIRRGKPDPEPYLQGAAKLRLPAQDCVVLEDAVSGTRSGKAAGARVIALRTTTPDSELLAAGADFLINDCASLRFDGAACSGLLHFQWNSEERPRVPKMH